MDQQDRRFDMTIIGSGPGGYVAAVRAAQLGLKTAVVEMYEQPGGTCLHWGCIPTKAMLHAAEVLETTGHASAFGIEVTGAKLDVARMQKYKTRMVQSNAKGVEYLFKKNGRLLCSFAGDCLLAPFPLRLWHRIGSLYLLGWLHHDRA